MDWSERMASHASAKVPAWSCDMSGPVPVVTATGVPRPVCQRKHRSNSVDMLAAVLANGAEKAILPTWD